MHWTGEDSPAKREFRKSRGWFRQGKVIEPRTRQVIWSVRWLANPCQSWVVRERGQREARLLEKRIEHLHLPVQLPMAQVFRKQLFAVQTQRALNHHGIPERQVQGFYVSVRIPVVRTAKRPPTGLLRNARCE